ncbi:MAG TPA: hypothetical protein VMZ28_22585 [Kofleriaceae bacterium]|nr:hypothetical protein [Kofleriaceae bacterium]
MPRATFLIALFLATGCLGAPAEGDGGRASDAGDVPPPDGMPCTGVQFAFAYVSQVAAPLAGGSLSGIAVVQALTAGVDLSQMTDVGPDGPSVNLYFSEVAFDEVPVGDAHGILSAEAAAFIIGPLVDEEDWTTGSQPGFGIEVSPSPSETTLEAEVEVRINGASIFLPISVEWTSAVDGIVGEGAARVLSECGG